MFSAALKKEAEIQHPVHEDLSFLVGTMFTDDNDDYSDEETAMICVFADKQVKTKVNYGISVNQTICSHKFNYFHTHL